ncbi:PREDICTED: uncharacterized protein LOC108370719 [Rhagoletis zephyria]|uniref:uncharacterized protein LOC108370719 n=1 Tax=Rhagoletis zephyria TaxID=28612 RepID=UPI0008115D5B|nr:PREDICTED: uncharacterized protein LOC108370719 [Rhagoletis zephyria]
MYLCQGSRNKIDIFLHSRRIEQVTSFKFLGRHISASLAVSEHYNEVIKRSHRNSNLFKCLTSIKAGLHPQVSLNYYKSLVRSKIEYCRSSTAHCSATVNNKIRTFQNSFLRRCLGATPATPIPLLYAIANELPPADRAKWLTAKELINTFKIDEDFRISLDRYPNVKSSYGYIFREFKHIFDRLEVIDAPIFSPNLTIVTKSFNEKKQNIAPEQAQAIYSQLLQEYEQSNFKIFYTDASVGANSTGCGIYNHTTKSEHGFRLPFKSSSSFGELNAIKKALELAAQGQYSKIAIFTDSLTACQLLLKVRTDNYCVLEIHKLIQQGDFNRVTIIWTPSHKGILGNEKADRIAKDAIISEHTLDVKLSVAEALNTIKNQIREGWLEGFKAFSMEKPNLFSKVFTCRKRRTWFYKCPLAPKTIKTLNRILSGFTYDTAYLYKIKAIAYNTCRCGEIDSYIHQTFHCRLLNDTRVNFEIFQNNTDFHDLFRDMNFCKITQLADFLQKVEAKF